MTEPVTMYRACDGSLHAIKGEAELRDKCGRFCKLMRGVANYPERTRRMHEPLRGLETLAGDIARHNPAKLDALIAVLEGSDGKTD